MAKTTPAGAGLRYRSIAAGPSVCCVFIYLALLFRRAARDALTLTIIARTYCVAHNVPECINNAVRVCAVILACHRCVGAGSKNSKLVLYFYLRAEQQRQSNALTSEFGRLEYSACVEQPAAASASPPFLIACAMCARAYHEQTTCSFAGGG